MENLNPEVNNNLNTKEIENDLRNSLNHEETTTRKDPGNTSKIDVYLTQDFLSDDVMGIVLGYKNGAIVSILAKELGPEARKMLDDLYIVTPQETKIYRNILQRIIRENFKDRIDEIANAINNDYAAALILEVGRLHSARTLIKASRDKFLGKAV